MEIKKDLYLTRLEDSIKHGFIDNLLYPSSQYAPKLIQNDIVNDQYILNEIQNEIIDSTFIKINVAFVTEAGIAMIKSQILDFAKKGGQGRIIISPYLGFNNPLALKELLKLPNFEVKITNEKINSHAKMFIFNKKVDKVVIIGSSNLTHNALKVNYELNLKLSSNDSGDYFYQAEKLFDDLWEKSIPLNDAEIQKYEEKIFNRTVTTPFIIREKLKDEVIKPNNMQEDALTGIQQLRDQGNKKALIISATGTGKTFLSAFDVKIFRPKKFLFVVHNSQILSKAMSDYQKVIGFKSDEAVLYKSGMNINNKKYVFATVQSISKDENIKTLKEDMFEYILIDEVHKAGANSYEKIMSHFKPDFLLGMTATPERTDNKNIYELFDFNVAYEIRLHKALEEDMLCPFIYFGVTEIYKGSTLLGEKVSINDLISEERVRHIIEKIEYYGFSGEKVKGLMFCRSKQEAKLLSNKLNEKGYNTKYLTGDDSRKTRENVVKELENNEIEYILTVDIFNEGIDIPSVNQVILLRNTESNIIFIQQLGRGLRKHHSKEYVTIIDFIGNYKNNYIIPMALFDDNSYNKDNYNRGMVNKRQLKGVTTINFEEIARKQIFDSIKQTNFKKFNLYKEKYLELKNRLGRTPYLIDYIYYKSIDPIVFFDGGKGNYGKMLLKFNDSNSLVLSDYEDKILTFLSNELLNGKRPHELVLLKMLLDNNGTVNKNEFKQYLLDNDIYFDNDIILSVERVLEFSFYSATSRLKYGEKFINIKNNNYYFNHEILKSLEDTLYLKLFYDVIEAGLLRSKKYPAGYTQEKLQIGEKYSRKDVCRLLCWLKDESSTMYGYKTKHGTTPIFVTYHKDEEVSTSLNYGEHFINQDIFHWYTRSRRNIKSNEVSLIINHKKNKNDLHFLVKKENAENSDFYYLGEVEYITDSARNDFMPDDKTLPVVRMDLKLKHPVPLGIFKYITEK
ncbi:DUF3427 domain-containing protein [Macrococcoides canis]|uniref:DUF3427 domain-containing protein n=1 Tax=Macrococcoides canis TaxID=1855823 RepID=UPI00105FE103|nr:DUF3427 domain-containing protein [Macrococcus canis]TDM21272.1 DUF3427 domain-containing protein [Macrococcus canis]